MDVYEKKAWLMSWRPTGREHPGEENEFSWLPDGDMDAGRSRSWHASAYAFATAAAIRFSARDSDEDEDSDDGSWRWGAADFGGEDTTDMHGS